MKASDLFVRALEAEGVGCVFAVPGEENLDLLESLRTSTVRLVISRHEQAAAFMAATWGRLTGVPGVVVTTLGPGATNLMTAAAYAQLGAMPLVMITGQKPLRAGKQGAFQIIDVVDMMAPVTKYTRQVVAATNLPARVREAFRRASEERPGATHLELPEDVLRDDTDAHVLTPGDVRRPHAADASISAAADLLRESKRPLVVIGAGANRAHACEVVTRFVTELGLPFITTQMGTGVVDETSAHYVGTAALSADDFVHRAVERADVIVNIGHSVVEKPPFIMQHNGLRVIHIDFNSAEVDPVYFPHVEVVGDIADTLTRLVSALSPAPAWDHRHIPIIQRAAAEHFAERASDNAVPLRPERVVHDVRQAMPMNSIVALDNGMYKIWFARNYPARVRHGLLLDNALATMGAGLPSAMAARMVHPDTPVLSVCGDGGFLMNSQELETAVRLNLDLVVLVLRDDGYGMIRWKQEELGFANFGLSFGNPDFVKYAEAYGAHGHRVTASGELSPMISKCLANGGVHVIEVPVTYEHDHVTLHEHIPKLASALSLPSDG